MTEAMPDTAPAEDEKPKRELSDEVIVNPDREVTLSNGNRLVVSPWGLKEGNLVLARIDAMTPALQGQADGWDAKKLLSAAWDEVVDLVSLTVDIPRTEMEKKPADGGWTFEDILVTTEAVLDVCILRSDGRGALPSLVALVGRMGEIAARTLAPALVTLRERDSEQPGSSPGNSGDDTA